MSNPRRKRKDNNHNEIQTKLAKLPAVSVVDISNFGNGIGDLLVGYAGKNFLFEIKNPNKKITYTSAEEVFRRSWFGNHYKIQSFDEACNILFNA
ncbi:MAG: hypothetical protein QY331_07635 [Melioribacteraceae bacterium]|nr:MAG: hypothetical protein QY331_07635 [Melioribacteraceae bacterium]